MPFKKDAPLIVQSDRTLFLEVDNPNFTSARDQIHQFAELIKSPEHIHTYRLSPISLWNAAASGLTAGKVLKILERFSRFDIPQNIATEIKDYFQRYGIVKLIKESDRLVLTSKDKHVITELNNTKALQEYFDKVVSSKKIIIKTGYRGLLKQALIKIGYPVEDLAGYVEGAKYPLEFCEETLSGKPFQLRSYQREAVEGFYSEGSAHGGAGVVVLPCGAGKTIVGMGAMKQIGCETLILSTNITALRQWRDELLDKTTVNQEDIGEYSGEIKEIKPITISTYQILTYRKSKSDEFPHFDLFNKRNWGLIIYDEVHLLPAPVFRITAEIQATRRLGLTATLVREDGKEDDVFSLIGPKRYDVPWRELEVKGFIAEAGCYEIRIPLNGDLRLRYATAEPRTKFRIASENPEKEDVIGKLLKYHQKDSILIIGQYLDQLRKLASKFEAPLITGQTLNKERAVLYGSFKKGEINILVVSKVANFAVDLPEANVAIQVSGTFGSRQEEAQRLGRILRPKQNGAQAYFYSLVTKDTREQEFAAKRQLFLTEQGYKYNILQEDEVSE